MPEYDLAFAAKLAELANEVDEKTPWAYDARRVVIYLSRLSFEITLKALLEKAGKPLNEIRKRSHNLRQLLTDLDDCEVQIEVTPGTREWSSAACIRAVTIDLGLARVPIGDLIDAENRGVSKYPNQIRYGEAITEVDSTLLASAAILAAKWAKDNWRTIKMR